MGICDGASSTVRSSYKIIFRLKRLKKKRLWQAAQQNRAKEKALAGGQPSRTEPRKRIWQRPLLRCRFRCFLNPHDNGLKPIETKVSETRHGYTVSQIKPHCSNMSNEFPFQCMICMVIGLDIFIKDPPSKNTKQYASISTKVCLKYDRSIHEICS